jgi:hypothetical protein
MRPHSDYEPNYDWQANSFVGIHGADLEVGSLLWIEEVDLGVRDGILFNQLNAHLFRGQDTQKMQRRSVGRCKILFIVARLDKGRHTGVYRSNQFVRLTGGRTTETIILSALSSTTCDSR